MVKLPTLYSRTSTGAIQQWTVEVDGNRYRTVYGQIDGKETSTKWTVAKPTNEGRSNERNAKEQALFEANAVWKNKSERGYFTDIKKVDKLAFEEPMLAQKYEDRQDEIVFPVYSQPKLDGIRCICTKDGMFSRQGKKFVSAPHISAALEPFFKKHPDAVLDGELYCDKLANDFNKICSLAKKSKPTVEDLKESAEKLEYHIYDLIDTIEVFSDRYSWLITNVPANRYNQIRLVSTSVIRSQNDLDEHYAAYVSAGYEGQMVRIDAQYERKRSKNLLKRKEFQDAEYVIESIHEGEGNRTGTAGYAILKNTNGETFKSNIKGSHEFLTELLKESDTLVGQKATVKFFNLTPAGVPRFPFITAIRNYE